MAYSQLIWCHKCDKSAHIVVAAGRPTPSVCGQCAAKEQVAKEEKHFAELDKLPMEERLRRVEKWIYHYKPTHVSPPRY
ncbi:MAG: hypothetical protein ACTSYQ_03565 [Candidatus Odinarchaeia archaeon]